MNRSGWWRRRPHDDSRATAPAERSRRESTAGQRATVLPDRHGRLSDGVVIETRLKARLLGVPVLRVNGTVVVSPGRLVELVDGDVVRGTRHESTAEIQQPGEVAPSMSAVGGTLAVTARLIADTDDHIARWRRPSG